jgi:hypothetical protein
MKHSVLVGAGAALLGIAACSGDNATQPQASQNLSPEVSAMLADGFTSSAAGFGQTTNSFVADADAFASWTPPGFVSGTYAHEDHELMGGGLASDFAGEASLGVRLTGGDDADDRGPFDHFSDRNCTFSSSTGRITCATVKIGGLTIERSFAYTDVKGQAQAKFDSTTDVINTRVKVSGSFVTRHRDTTTVDHASDQTVSGLAKGSTKRTVNATSGGTETTKGTTDNGASFTAQRVIGDTTAKLVVPVANRRPSYPTSGTVTRSMKVTVTVGTQAPATKTRREVITYDGSSTAKVVITKNDSTKTCTQPLPHGHLTCS